MASSPLPEERERLQDLLDQSVRAEMECSSTLATLREMESAPRPIAPTRLSRLPGGQSGFSVSQIGLSRPLINESILTSAVTARPLLNFMELDNATRMRVVDLAAIFDSRRSSGVNTPIARTPGILLDGLVEFDIGQSWEPKALDDQNALRISIVANLFDSLSQAIPTLVRRIHKKLDPPSVRDRVRVDVSRGFVVVDDVHYSVPQRQAVFFDYLSKANGAPVSGPEIAASEGLKEFRGNRIKNQIKDKKLRAIIKESRKGKRGFFIQLPPLD